MKIVHISDLHLNHEFDKKLTRRIYKFLKYISGIADHIVITGDISDDARQEDFEVFRGILQKLNLLDGERLSLVIGNHDIFGGVVKAEDILLFPQKCRTTDFSAKVHQFNDYFSESFENCVYRSEHGYPFAKIINKCLFVGLNSIASYSPIKNPFASNGKIDSRQMAETQLIFDDFSKFCEKKVILVHHHFNKMKFITGGITERLWLNIEKQTMKLRKKKELLSFFKANQVDLILHGHLHKIEEYVRKEITLLNAGGSIKGTRDEGFFYNKVTLRENKFTVKTGTKTITLKDPNKTLILPPVKLAVSQ